MRPQRKRHETKSWRESCSSSSHKSQALDRHRSPRSNLQSRRPSKHHHTKTYLLAITTSTDAHAHIRTHTPPHGLRSRARAHESQLTSSTHAHACLCSRTTNKRADGRSLRDVHARQHTFFSTPTRAADADDTPSRYNHIEHYGAAARSHECGLHWLGTPR